MTPTFEKLDASSSFFVLAQSAIATPSRFYGIAFLPASEVDSSTLTLAQTWIDHPGVYLFLNVVPGEATQSAESALQTVLNADFEAALHHVLRDPTLRQVRFLWIENPQESFTSWRINQLSTAPSTQPEEQLVDRVTYLDIQNYALAIARNSTIRLADDSFLITKSRADGFRWMTGYGVNQIEGIGDEIQLPFTGSQAGCLQFTLTLKRPESSQPNSPEISELKHLEVGFQLFFNDPDFTNTVSDFYLTSTFYPLWFQDDAIAVKALLDGLKSIAPSATSPDRYYTQDVVFNATLDLLNPLDEARSYFELIAPAELPSCYRTNLGYTVHLTSHNGKGRMVFAPKPSASNSLDSALYLTPSGEFVITIPRYGAESAIAQTDSDNLLCGLSGVEYVKLASDQTNLLCFRPGQAAYAPGFAAVASMTDRLLDLVSLYSNVSRDHLQRDDFLEPHLNITNVERIQILEELQRAYFPPDYSLSSKEQDKLIALKTLDELVIWFQQTLRASKPVSAESLTTIATTAWAYIRQIGETEPIYYAQPDQAVLYQPSPQNSSANLHLLRYMEVKAATLPDPENNPLPVFPLLPYGGVQTKLMDYRELELKVISPLRRSRITEITVARPIQPLVTTDEAPEDNSVMALNAPVRIAAFAAMKSAAVSEGALATSDDQTGTTPQGLLATFSNEFNTLKTLLLAKGTDDVDVTFNGLEKRSPLWDSLQSNQLFLVISDATKLKAYFQQNQLNIQDWIFNLNPDDWRENTVLIFKFYNKPLIELLETTNTWSLPDEFNIKPAETRLTLANFFKEVLDKDTDKASVKDRENYANLARAARLENWSGILALNVKVPPSNFPESLQALAAGIKEDQFYAQYVGIETTPIRPENGQLVAGQSSLFGLIDYQDDSVPPPNPSGYNFQVTLLRVLFQNSQIKAFSSEINITLDRLFDERTQLLQSTSGRNIVVLKGTAENHNGKTTYAFSFSGENHFALPDSYALNEVEVIKAQFSTDPIANPSDPATTITGRFTFWGRLDFKYLEKFDVFSFGATPASNATTAENDQFLSFSNLVVTLKFAKNKPGDREFKFDPSNLTFDLQKSKVRPNSLHAKFPIKLNSFVYLDGTKKTTGYLPVKTPLGSGQLPNKGYGLVFDLDMGNLGALAGVTRFVSSLLVAWVPNTSTPSDQDVIPDEDTPPKASTSGNFFVGLRLPGLSGDVLGFALQNVIKLSFKSVEFVVEPGNEQRAISYILKLKSIALKLFVFSFPPNGQTELIIFGNPNAEDSNDAIGWYAAYAKTPPPTNSPGQLPGTASSSTR